MAKPIADEADALDELEEVLGQAIKGQSIADVPVGAFLSGGIDSSTVVALYQKHSSTPVRTFSIGFEEGGFNEAENARVWPGISARSTKSMWCGSRKRATSFRSCPQMYDEPFADSSQIPTHLVSRFARDQVTVALTGDGGDELFAGYNRHFLAPWLWKYMRAIPLPLRAAAAAPMGRVPPTVWQSVARALPRTGEPTFWRQVPEDLARCRQRTTFRRRLSELPRRMEPRSRARSGGARAATAGFDLAFVGQAAPPDLRMMYCDAVTYLPDDILCKVDRASMAVSLETRVPFLDHRVAEVAARIPLEMKVRGRQREAHPARAACIGTRRANCSSVPRQASPFRSANGSRDRSVLGRKIFWIPAAWLRMAGSILRSCNAAGRIILRVGVTRHRRSGRS